MALSKGQTIGLIFFVLVLIVGIVLIIYFTNKSKKDDDDDDDDKKKKKTSGNTSNTSTTPTNSDDPYTILNMTGYYTSESATDDRWTDLSPARNHMTGTVSIRGSLNVDANGFVTGTTTSGFKIPDRVIGLYNDEYTMFFIGKQVSNLISTDSLFMFGDDLIYGMEQSNGRKRLNGVDISSEPLTITMEGETFSIQGNTNKFTQTYNYGEPRMIRIPTSNIPYSSSNIIITVNSSNIVASNTSVESSLKSLLPAYSNVAGLTDEIVLQKPITYSVNFGEDKSDFAFKELIFYKSILNDERIGRVERYFKKQYGNLMNDVPGLYQTANITTSNVMTSTSCREYATSQNANAFAINLETKQCIIYEDVAQLLNWNGNTESNNYISYCTDKTKSITKGCN